MGLYAPKVILEIYPGWEAGNILFYPVKGSDMIYVSEKYLSTTWDIEVFGIFEILPILKLNFGETQAAKVRSKGSRPLLNLGKLGSRSQVARPPPPAQFGTDFQI